MYIQAEKNKENKNRAVANSVAQRERSGSQSFEFVDNRPSTAAQRFSRLQSNNILRLIQRDPDDISMSAAEGALLDNYKRKVIVDRIYKYIKANGLGFKITNLENTKRYFNEEYEGSFYNKFRAAAGPEKTAMTKEILARKYHDDTASGEITSEMRTKLGRGEAISEGEEDTEGPDIKSSSVLHPNKGAGRDAFEIKSNLTPVKACVITALMFSEGGGVLGAGSVEELHFILSTRFKTTWRHYSEEKVYKSLYEHIGYKKSVPDATTKLQNLSTILGGETFGMVSIEGHMIGFKVESNEIFLRDNDEGMKKPNTHSKKLKNIKEIWTK
jgi:hypothetical protein